MVVSSSDQARFFDLEIKAQLIDYARITQKRLVDLRQSGEVIVGFVKCEENSMYLHHAADFSPREDYPYGLVRPDTLKNHKLWGNATLDTLLDDSLEGTACRVRSGKIQQTASASISARLTELLLSDPSSANFFPDGCVAVLYPEPPPLDYLRNLSTFCNASPRDAVLQLSHAQRSWQPLLLGNSASERVGQFLQDGVEHIVTQGPPGTGKTHLAAAICATYLKRGLRVAVTGLTHRSLMELVVKPDLYIYLNTAKLFKRGLTRSEAQEAPGLQDAEDLSLSDGQLLLATYHSMSAYANDIPHVKPYDLLIIEEASQAFLATLALFCRLAKQVWIIGDPQQLAPIATGGERSLRHIALPLRRGIVNGLETLGYNGFATGTRLTASYRLGPRAAKLTGMFYENSLTSQHASRVAPFKLPVHLKLALAEGVDGQALLLAPSARGQSVTWTVARAAELAEAAAGHEISIAILCQQISRVKEAQLVSARYLALRTARVETVDRVQGLTVDFTFYVPGHSIHAWASERFNVATSRARYATFIVVPEGTRAHMKVPGVVGQIMRELAIPGPTLDAAGGQL